MKSLLLVSFNPLDSEHLQKYASAAAPTLAEFGAEVILKGPATSLAGMDGEDLAALGDYMASGQMMPVIDQRFPFAKTADAIRYSETGRARGKIVVTME